MLLLMLLRGFSPLSHKHVKTGPKVTTQACTEIHIGPPVGTATAVTRPGSSQKSRFVDGGSVKILPAVLSRFVKSRSLQYATIWIITYFYSAPSRVSCRHPGGAGT